MNCRQRSSENAVLQRIIAHFDERYPDRGFSTAEMLRSITKHIEKRHMHLVVVLDEADVLIKRGASDLIYQLSRFDEEKISPRPSHLIDPGLAEVCAGHAGPRRHVHLPPGQRDPVRPLYRGRAAGHRRRPCRTGAVPQRHRRWTRCSSSRTSPPSSATPGSPSSSWTVPACWPRRRGRKGSPPSTSAPPRP